MILRNRFARSIIGTHPLTVSLRAGCVRAARAGQGLPRRTRRGCGDPAPGRRNVPSWMVVSAAEQSHGGGRRCQRSAYWGRFLT